MSTIDIRHHHSKSPEDARSAVEKIADKIQGRFDVACTWDGNTLSFNRTGVDGSIEVSDDEIHVLMKLGFLYSALRAPIEGEIRRYLEREFA